MPFLREFQVTLKKHGIPLAHYKERKNKRKVVKVIVQGLSKIRSNKSLNSVIHNETKETHLRRSRRLLFYLIFFGIGSVWLMISAVQFVGKRDASVQRKKELPFILSDFTVPMDDFTIAPNEIEQSTQVPHAPVVESTQHTPPLKKEVPEPLACHFPQIEAFNEDVKGYLKPASEIPCPLQETPLFRIDLEGNLIRLRNTETYNFTDCCYRVLTRQNDFKTKNSSDCKKITTKTTRINASLEYIVIECVNITSNASKWIDAFALVPKRIPRVSKFRSSRHKINVVMLGVDATSQLNFKRVMPQTLEFLTTKLGAIGLQWLNKHGDNTFPNMISVLTGYSQAEIKDLCWPRARTSFDLCPFIWKQYSDEGYLTTYGEDLSSVSTFHYEKGGFQYPPTDYYPRPVTLFQQDNMGKHYIEGLAQCYGSHKPAEIVLDHLERLVYAMEKRKQLYFQYWWTGSLTHSTLNMGALLDRPVLATLKFLNKRKYLNNTVFVLMSDHGFRFGGYRNTFSGDVENRMPFAYFVFPEWFKRKFPAALANFKRNAEERLTSFFDVHRTLKDLLFLDWELPDKRIKEKTEYFKGEKALPRDFSLFVPIPAIRTCEHIGISKEYCICDMLPKIADLKHPLLESSAAFLLQTINEIIAKQGLCSKLELAEVINAEGVLNGSGHGWSKSDFLHSITIMTVPGNATFEAVLKRQTETQTTTEKTDLDNGLNDWRIVGEIIRTNMYKNQSHCVQDTVIKNYCYCKNQEINLSTDLTKQ